MKKDIITDTLRKLSYKNISIDTTKGRDIIAGEILKSLSEKFYLFKWVKDSKNKPDCNDEDFEIGPWKDEDGNCGY